MVKIRPNTLGNVWMLGQSERGIEYLSDQYGGRVLAIRKLIAKRSPRHQKLRL